MEIETTLAELPNRLKALSHPSSAKVRLQIEEVAPEPSSRWSYMAERLQSAAPLSGCGDSVLEQSQAFRDEFAFPQDSSGK